MLKVLAFDCAGSGCAAAVMVGDRVAARRAAAMERGQAEALIPMIEAVCDEAGTPPGTLDLIAVTVGPGSFTGVRIGLAAARGLALAAGIAAVGVTSFAAVAAGVAPARRAGRPLAVVLESKRAEVFLQCFGPAGPALGEGVLVLPEAAMALLPPGRVMLAGDAAARLLPFLGKGAVLADGPGQPDCADIARLACASWRPGERPAPPRPLYLRAPDTTLKVASAMP